LFHLDGVPTQTATLHLAAWKHTFDALLAGLGEGESTRADYAAYVDGRRRYDAVRTFLASRGIEREEGSPHDPPEADTICGIGNRKNADVQRILDTDGVDTFPGYERSLAADREAVRATTSYTATSQRNSDIHAAQQVT